MRITGICFLIVPVVCAASMMLSACHDEDRHAPERTTQRPGGGGDDEPPVEPEASVAVNLADATMRITGAGVSLVFSEPGTIFVRESGGCGLRAVSIVNGTEASVVAPQPLADYDGVSMPASSAGFSLIVNGNAVPLRRAELMKADGRCVWLRFVSAGGDVVWIVAERDF